MPAMGDRCREATADFFLKLVVLPTSPALTPYRCGGSPRDPGLGLYGDRVAYSGHVSRLIPSSGFVAWGVPYEALLGIRLQWQWISPGCATARRHSEAGPVATAQDNVHAPSKPLGPRPCVREGWWQGLPLRKHGGASGRQDDDDPKGWHRGKAASRGPRQVCAEVRRHGAHGLLTWCMWLLGLLGCFGGGTAPLPGTTWMTTEITLFMQTGWSGTCVRWTCLPLSR